MAKTDEFYFGDDDQEVEDGNGTSTYSRSSTGDIDDEDVVSDDDPTNDKYEVEEVEEDKKEKAPKAKSKAKEESSEKDEESEEEDENKEEEQNEEKNEEIESTIEIIAKDFVQKGILLPKEGEEYDDSEEGLVQLMEDTIEARILEDVPEEYASLLDAIKQGIPASEWVSLVAPDTDLADVDLEDEDNQEILVARAAKLQGLSDDKIAKRIERFKKLDTLKEEAEDAHAILLERDEKQKEANNQAIIDARKKELDDQRKRIEKTYKDAEKLTEVQGVPLTKKAQKELAEYVTKPVNAKGQTQYMLDRNDPDILLQAAYLVKNAKNNTLQKVADSKAAESLKSKLDARNDNMSSKKGNHRRDTDNSALDNQPWSRSTEVED